MLADIIKIHCLKHRANFPMSRTSRTVVCKEGLEEHVLSNNFPYSGLWIYCCNCQTFIAWNSQSSEVSVKECPFCLSSLNPRLYSCDHCAVTMVDFDDQTLRKHHTVLSWGMPQPACPGCHKFPSYTPRMHFCKELQCNLASARQVCPFCQEEIEEPGTDTVKTTVSRIDTALAEAEARVRDAEERERLAEAATRKEIELRVIAERKADEIERKVTSEIGQPQAAGPIPDSILREAEFVRARAEAEIRARVEAEARVRESEELRKRAEASARKESEMRQLAEDRIKEIAAIHNNNNSNIRTPPQVIARKDKVSIALYAAIATFLFLALIVLIITMIRLY